MPCKPHADASRAACRAGAFAPTVPPSYPRQWHRMLRRAFLSFLPAGLLPVVLALAFLIGIPGAGAGTPEASATTRNTEQSRVVREILTRDILDVALIQGVDEDDTPDDRILRPSSRIFWNTAPLADRILCASHTGGPSHRPCSAQSRAPPTA